MLNTLWICLRTPFFSSIKISQKKKVSWIKAIKYALNRLLCIFHQALTGHYVDWNLDLISDKNVKFCWRGYFPHFNILYIRGIQEGRGDGEVRRGDGEVGRGRQGSSEGKGGEMERLGGTGRGCWLKGTISIIYCDILVYWLLSWDLFQ